jgi:hypothetical protein
MPMTISKSYTVSLHEKSALRKDLAAWRGKDFTEEEAKAFDVSKLLGAYCMVNVTTSETNGKTYSNVAGLTPLPAALKNAKPAGVHEFVTFNLDEPDMEVFNTFHDKLQEAIKRSPEWAHAKALLDRVKTARKRSDWLRQYLHSHMQACGVLSIKADDGTFSAVLAPGRDKSVEIYDAAQLPQDYLREVPAKYEPDKTLIRKALDDNFEVPGARLVAKDRLTIK